MNQDRTQQTHAEIRELCADRPPIRLMEVCGTHTVALFRTGIRSLLPSNLRLVSGPGCPVCVTPQGYMDAACQIASRPGVAVCTFGDMVRVPGSSGSLADRRAHGAEIVVVYSARDALQYAEKHPDRAVVFLAIGFETTAPTTAAVILEAARKNIPNFTALPGHKLALPAMLALLRDDEFPIDGFLCPGHVSVITGSDAYRPIAERYGKPCAIAGFEPTQILEGIRDLARQVARGEARVDNAYGIAVTDGGNSVAQSFMRDVFTVGPAVWRSLGTIPESGLDFREEYRRFDAAEKFEVETTADFEPDGCRCGEVIQGKTEPRECALFGKACTPMNPIGPCMVGSEGTCAAWHKYGPSRQQ